MPEMPNLPKLSALDLTALIASKVCHDIISPVGALANGLEVLDEDSGEEMDAFAMDLIRKSAKSASAKLKFARLAFGASGSAGADIDTGEAEEVVALYLEAEKPEMEWKGERSLVPKNRIKLLLNLLLVAMNAVPRGGTIHVDIIGANGDATFKLRCVGPKARVPEKFLDMLGGISAAELSPHDAQTYYTLLLAQDTGLSISAHADGEDVVLSVS